MAAPPVTDLTTGPGSRTTQVGPASPSAGPPTLRPVDRRCERGLNRAR